VTLTLAPYPGAVMGVDTDWTAGAACATVDPDDLFVTGAAQQAVKRVCHGCPVKAQCLADALDHGIDVGVWGGMTERERRALVRRHPEVTSWKTFLQTFHPSPARRAS
jgi:WhiB family redox-sensing transcriptional regulator